MSRRLLATLIVIVALAGVAVAALATFASVEDRTTTVRPGPIRRLEVDVEAGRIEVVTGTSNEVKVDRTRRYIRGGPVVRETFVDGVLRLQSDCRTFVAVGCRVDYRVELPAAVPVRIRSDRGSVAVEGMTGMVEVETEAGGVRLVRTGGPVQVTTSAGSIEGVDLVAPFLDAETGAGRIRISLIQPSPRVSLQSGAGSIDLTVPEAQGGYRVVTETGSGEVDVGVGNDPGANRAITARTGAGSIRITAR